MQNDFFRDEEHGEARKSAFFNALKSLKVGESVSVKDLLGRMGETAPENPEGCKICGETETKVDVAGFDKKAKTLELSFSSETPYQRWWGVEILGHNPEEINMEWISSGRAPLLKDHEMDKQTGIVEKAFLGDDRKCHATVRFGESERAEGEFKDVCAGIRCNVSVGYSIEELQLVKQEDGVDTYRVTKWTPHEISLVSVPADPTVGVGRSAEAPETIEPPVIETKAEPVIETKAVEQVQIIETKENEMSEIDLAQVRADEAKRSASINALAVKHNQRALGDKFIAEGKTLDEFRGALLDVIAEGTPLETPVTQIGMSEKEAQRFSLTNYLRSIVEGNPQIAAFELEAVEAVKKNMAANGVHTRNSQFILPYDVMQQPLSTRATITTTSADKLVPTEHWAQDFITVLRNACLVRQMGARFIGGLSGNVSIPKQTAPATANFVAEASQATESTSTAFSNVEMSPKALHSYLNVSRDLLIQGSPDVESLLRMDLIQTLATKLDWAALHGTGSNSQPRGVANTSGIGSVVVAAGGSFTYSDMVALETKIAEANVMGSLGYLTNAKIRGSLKLTQQFSGTNGVPVWTAPLAGDNPALFGMVNGYRAGVSNNVATDNVFFGDWTDLLIGEWGAVELLEDRVTQADKRVIRMHAWQYVDIAVRRPQAFALATIAQGSGSGS